VRSPADFAALAADPRAAEHFLKDLLRLDPEMADRPDLLRPAAVLAGASRFLARHVLQEPDEFRRAVEEIRHPVDRPFIENAVRGKPEPGTTEEVMRFLRLTRKRMLLRIALRDLLGRSDLGGIMAELTALGEFLIDRALAAARREMIHRYGRPDDDRFAVIALGKLGAGELNFSSDVDLMYVYGPERGETSGVRASTGVRRNRISNHEYYCRLAESMGKLLSAATADGIAHRVDLRLRPEGSRGDLALSLAACELYYESYGREWERAVLLRARPVAGDAELGRDFLRTVEPFVYRRHLDFGAIEELKNMKIRIDSASRCADIKRGPGGIREIEFFVQSFQLIYGGRDPLLRERHTLVLLHRLGQKGLVAEPEQRQLAEAYAFLRTVEHRLQMQQDLQTHALPRSRADLEILARASGCADAAAFEKMLNDHRGRVHRIYSDLFGRKAAPDESGLGEETALFFGEDLTDEEIAERLAAGGYQNPERAARSVGKIRETIRFNQTFRTRQLLRRLLPRLYGRVKTSADPDQALDFLRDLLVSIGSNEAYLSILAEETPLADHLVTLFAEAAYLSRYFVAHPALLDALREQGVYGYRTLAALKRDLQVTIRHSADWASAIRVFKLMEEIRLGLLYLNGEITMTQLLRGLSKTAEAVLDETLRTVTADLVAGSGTGPDGSLTVIGLGKLGGRELSYGSDLDIVFLHSGGGQDFFTRTAEKVIARLSSYTREGIAYKVDTRLRPTGSKGPLVQDLMAARRYYLEESELWERQTLLRARPVAGDLALGSRFFWITREILAMGGREEDLAGEIRAMRRRIENELGRERGGTLDLKFGPGGLNELEFTIQYLQLRHVRRHPRVVVPGTSLGIRRLKDFGFLSPRDAARLEATYLFFREIDTMIRLMGIGGVPKQGPDLEALARKLRRASGAGLLGEFTEARQAVRELWNRLVS